MSKCFEVRSDEIAAVECKRQYGENWDSEFTTPERYANYKLNILQKDMRINLEWDDIKHMRELTSVAAIDAAFRSIINRYWV